MFKKALKIAGGLLLGLFVIAMLAKVYADRKYFDNYDPKAPYNVQVLDHATDRPASRGTAPQMINPPRR